MCDLLTKFVVLQFISRVCVVLFWLDSWEEDLLPMLKDTEDQIQLEERVVTASLRAVPHVGGSS